ncbi:ATP-dependent exoDNAse (exonuclease V) beta subunit [Tenacibaculum adriaticum]|uniref:DNA 3'-5' helicase n=1 Tax=Tenacibaculum adriaticum TaxID=413713 RepID=A0A5S5DUU3_9FLAO|nr:UvrD-helicase domain-containing protein [Tenacibaculum adriaticum]TYP99641.1 ATP-dependent exoDNAse (exonuclease V) beta subunit [Tenacibaculum adriaticum]
MQNPTNFQVYNASAGSGKTFTLVKEYLKIILQSEDIFRFQKILAITFTNKAANEMKERVMKNLHAFSEGKETDMSSKILEETSLDSTTIQERSKKILDAILQNYSAFSITTIDSFTHKIIKNFAHDLGLTLNFEVEMDAVSLLSEAVDVLISKIGTNEELTKLLIDFSLSKIDDDKSWDISRELNDFSRILLNEDDVKHFRSLSEKTIEDFFQLKEKLIKANTQIEMSFKEVGKKALDLIKNNHLQISDFAYAGECPNHFKKLLNFKNLKVDDLKFEGRIDKNFSEDKNLYSAKASAASKSTIDDLYDEFKNLYLQSKTLFENSHPLYVINNLALKSIIPLAVLNNINSELNNLKEENNIRLNAEFNQLISDNIKDQPAPFIYERIGQKFMHYFIDEMQDTSVLQWQNLIPLIDNALAQENSNLLIVGDGKQAIYRWRGGKAEQFINLGSEEENAENPFYISKEIKELATNYRSYSEVINFNNNFFQHTANFLQNDSYKKLFLEGNKQLENAKKGGFVSLSFLEKEGDKEDEKFKYQNKVLEKITALKKEFSLSEICVLVRKKKDGIAVANYLSEKGIDIVSSETLLLKNSSKVNFITDILQIIQHPNDEETRFNVLYFLHHHLKVQLDKHSFLNKLVKNSLPDIFNHLKEYNVSFSLEMFHQLPFYEKIEEIIRGFQLINSSDAYVQFFLDVVLDQQRKGTSIQEFLDFWNDKKKSLSIVAPESSDAVNVMTIHKSKGLEFPVVIFPYDLDIYQQIQPKVWFDELPENFEGFNELLIDYGKSLSYINDKGLQIYEQQREELELDNFNLLYVALTRAVEQLYIITEKRISRAGENTNYYSGIFINYLKEMKLWTDEQLEYSFGGSERVSKNEPRESLVNIQQEFISTPWQQHNIAMLASSSKLWDTEQGKAIDFGNLIHEMMAKIIKRKDVDKVVSLSGQQGEIPKGKLSEIKGMINMIVNHDQLQYYFSDEVSVFNEREIVSIDNQIIIPDRLVFENESVTIIDYKTGKPDKKYHQQVLKYANILKLMNFKVDKKLLVYINDEILVEEIG